MNEDKREINTVCFECGEKYGNIPFPTHNFSVWGGVCDICGHEYNVNGLDGGVTSVRDFGYLKTDTKQHFEI